MKGRIAIALGVLGCAAVLGLSARADDKAEPAAAELKKLQGTWMYESQEMGGQKVPAEQIKNMVIVFDGDKFTVKDGDKVVQAGTNKIDPVKKAVEATVTEGVGKGTTMLGIYEVDGDTMKACFDMEGKKRPTEFKSADAPTVFVAVMKRVKK